MNRYRRFITTGVGFSFVVVGLTGVLFKFFFKNHPLEEIHGWIGIGLVAAAIGHIAQNWTPLQGYFRDWRVFLLLLPILLVIALIGLAPRETDGDGVNPRVVVRKLAQGSAVSVATAFGKDVNTVFASMKQDGLRVGSGDETVQNLARENQKSPEGILAYFAE